MLFLICAWFLVGLGVYMGMASCNMDTYEDAEWDEVIMGVVFAFILWPVGLYLMILAHIDAGNTPPKKKYVKKELRKKSNRTNSPRGNNGA